MNRPRKKGNRDLPPNLYSSLRGGKVYYAYKHPHTGKHHGMGHDRRAAIDAAHQLNAALVMPISLVDRVLGRVDLFGGWLDRYLDIRLSEGNLSPKTVRILRYDVELMRKALGALPMIDLSVFHCAEFVSQWTEAGKRRMAARMRSQLIICLDYAASHGLIDDNPAKKTLAITAQTHRSRLTKAQFDAIYALAAPPIQNAMLLALVTLQRREDIASMKFKDVKGGFLYIRQGKTAKIRKGRREGSLNVAAHIMLATTWELPGVGTVQDAIRQCRGTQVISRHMVHHIHGRKAAGATHAEVKPGLPLQPDNLTRGFASARDRSGLFGKMAAKEKPTFHEIRSLGAHLYKEAGIDPQALLGHTDAKMTDYYLDGHGEKWTKIV